MRITREEVAELVKAGFQRGYVFGLEDSKVRLEQERRAEEVAVKNAEDLLVGLEREKAAARKA